MVHDIKQNICQTLKLYVLIDTQHNDCMKVWSFRAE